MEPKLVAIRGRGTATNPANRFERLHFEAEADVAEGEEPAGGPRTVYLRDTSRSIVARNDSPDVGFDFSVNPYRGCEHGCVYCYARPTHEYLGFSAGLDFETRILVKETAPELLRSALASPRWSPAPVAMSGVTDAYQPVERRLRLTRRCLEVLAEFRNPVMIVTKNHLVTRDVDLLGELAAVGAARVALSITSLDAALQRRMEPRTSPPERRLAALETLAAAGVPTTVMVAPVVPGLTDHELPEILSRAADAGARSAAFITLRLPHGVAGLFEQWLATHYPDRRERVLGRVRAVRGGRLNDPRFGSRMRGHGAYADQIRELFHVSCRRLGLEERGTSLSTAAFRRPRTDPQLGLFDDAAGAP